MTQCCIYETLFKNNLYKFYKKTVLFIYIYNWLSWLFQQQKIAFLYRSWAVSYISLLCINDICILLKKSVSVILASINFES